MEKVTFQCECGQKLSAKAEKAGSSFRCPQCKETVIVPFLAPEEGIQEPPPRVDIFDRITIASIRGLRSIGEDITRSLPSLIRLAKFFVPACLSLLALALWSEDSSTLSWIVSDVSVAFLPVVLLWSFSRTKLNPWLCLGLVGFGVLLSCTYHSFGTYRDFWSDDEFRRVDFYYRNGEIFHRSLSRIENSQTAGQLRYAEGDMTETHKLHGKWTSSYHLQPDEFDFYWYGEIISEGEWHRLSGE